MVNSKPLAPRKHHTFNENQSAYHEDAKNKIVLNSNANENGNDANLDTNKPNVDVIYFKKPLVRTGSSLITVKKLAMFFFGLYFISIFKDNKIQKTTPRKPPKEFLSATISPRLKFKIIIMNCINL
jgi:hypothetical protein